MSCNSKIACAACASPGEVDREADETLPLPSAEALLAGTLALMTGVVERAALAQPLAAHAQSLMMASKVRSNLYFLASHPHISEGFRLTAGRLRTHWDRLAVPAQVAQSDAAAEGAEAAARLWHRAPERVQ